MRLKKLQMLTAAATMALSLSTHAADFITFDPTGVGGVSAGDLTNVSAFDWLFGNALAAGVNSTNGIAVGTSFTTYYQANLGTVVRPLAGDPDFLNGSGGNFFTAVAAFGETVTGCTSGSLFACQNAEFSFNASTPNFFRIYKTTGEASDFTGAGFTGTLILSGTVVPTGFSSNFNVSGAPTATTLCGSVLAPTTNCLDQSANGNQWPGVSTVTGSGGSTLQIVVDSALANYFPDIAVGTLISFSFFNTSQVLAFNETDPSKCFATLAGDCKVTSTIGAINGAPIVLGGGKDVIFQADANQSFTRAVNKVPEPGTLALAGLALITMVGLGRRRRV